MNAHATQSELGGAAARRAPRPSRAWCGLALVLVIGVAVVLRVDPHLIDWEPGLAWHQPWRWWSAAWVHWSDGHRWANAIGALLVAALGWRAGCDRYDSTAWCLAWPLTHLGLLLQPTLAHYGGLSGVLHAGVVVAACSLWHRERGKRRLLGAAIGTGVVLKVLLEQPWHGPLQRLPGWDIDIAPAAHLSGALVGAVCALITALARHLRSQITASDRIIR